MNHLHSDVWSIVFQFLSIHDYTRIRICDQRLRKIASQRSSWNTLTTQPVNIHFHHVPTVTTDSDGDLVCMMDFLESVFQSIPWSITHLQLTGQIAGVKLSNLSSSCDIDEIRKRMRRPVDLLCMIHPKLDKLHTENLQVRLDRLRERIQGLHSLTLYCVEMNSYQFTSLLDDLSSYLSEIHLSCVTMKTEMDSLTKENPVLNQFISDLHRDIKDARIVPVIRPSAPLRHLTVTVTNDSHYKLLPTIAYYGRELTQMKLRLPWNSHGGCEMLSFQSFPRLKYLDLECKLPSDWQLNCMGSLRLESLTLRGMNLAELFEGDTPAIAFLSGSSLHHIVQDMNDGYLSRLPCVDELISDGEVLSVELYTRQLRTHLRRLIIPLKQVNRGVIISEFPLLQEIGEISEWNSDEPDESQYIVKDLEIRLPMDLLPPGIRNNHKISLWQSDVKGRFIRATKAIEEVEILWQETPVVCCTSEPNTDETGDTSYSIPNASADHQRIQHLFTKLLPELPSHVSPYDLLIVIHLIRSIEYDTSSTINHLLHYLQSTIVSDAPETLKERFRCQSDLANRIVNNWKMTAKEHKAEVSNKINPDIVERILGIIHLNAHRCVDIPGSLVDTNSNNTNTATTNTNTTTPTTTTTASSTSDPATVASSSLLPRGKSISLHFSMLEHNCSPNIEFYTEWIKNTELPIHLQPLKDAAPSTNTTIVSIGSNQSLCASNGRLSSYTLLLTVRAKCSIPAYHPLSISYYPCRVRTLMRQQHLSRQYGFLCSCDRCIGPDETRSFYCTQGIITTDMTGKDGNTKVYQRCTGLVRQAGSGSTIIPVVSDGHRTLPFQCGKCEYILSEDEFVDLCEWEQSLMRSDEEWKKFISDKKNNIDTQLDGRYRLYPHESHYLLNRKK